MKKKPGISLYHQIEQDIHARIESLEPNTKIESEQQLSKIYGVSRGTIRQAVNNLVSKGLLVKIQGSGTFRANNTILKQSYFVNKSFTKQILDSGNIPGISDIKLSEAPVNEHIAKHLKISQDLPVFHLTRVRHMNGEPFGLGTAYIRKEFVPNLKVEDLEMSLINMLINKFNLTLTNRFSYCSACTASSELAKILPLNVKSPILKIEHVCSVQDGPPLLVDVFQLTNSFTLALEFSKMHT